MGFNMAKYGYIRTSKNKQIMDRQLYQLADICDKVFIEKGVSANAKHRPEFEKLMRKLKRGDVFIVTSQDRAFRNTIESLLSLSRLEKKGIMFHSLAHGFDPYTADGKLFFTIHAALAEWEINNLAHRITEGVHAARRRGSKLGRPKKLTPEKVKEAKTLLQNNHQSMADVAAHLNVHPTTLKREIGHSGA